MFDQRVQAPPAYVAALEEFIPEVMRVTRTPGLNLAIARGGEVVWEAAFGVADLASERAMTTETVTRGGSMAKLYIAVAALQLAECGVLDLFAPVDEHLDDVPVRNPLGERHVTMYDLLTHRSGLATDTIDASLGVPPALTGFVTDALAGGHAAEYNLERSRWIAKVGARPQYSSLGLALAGLVVERLNPDGLSFTNYVARHITEPLGMTSTCIVPVANGEHVPSRILDNVSTGYARFDDVLIPTPVLHSANYPSVTLLTTPGDHLRLIVALMDADPRLLAAESVRAMLTPQVEMTAFTPHDPWCVGLVAELHGAVDDPGRYFGHGGAHPWGWYGDSRGYPDLGLACVVLTNKWDMLRWHNPAIENAHGFINELLIDLVRAPREPAVSPRSWKWRRAYVTGLLMAERLHGFLGVRDRLGVDDALALAEDARTLDGPAPLDPDAFACGYSDLLAGGARPAEISATLRSGHLPVRRAEIRLVCHALDRRGRLPVPMAFFADARGVPSAGQSTSDLTVRRPDGALG